MHPLKLIKKLRLKSRLKELNLTMIKNNVLPSATPESRAKGLGAFTPSKVIRGRVESVDGVPLPGVNVMFKNTNIGTVTDGSGNYQLSVAETNRL